MSLRAEFLKGLVRENPTFRLVLGMCPTLAVTTSFLGGFGMGIATTVVLVGSNLIISLLRNFIPEKIRIPSFIVVIASFVTIVDALMQAYTPPLAQILGIFIPLIVVNCIILARAEAFASKNGVLPSVADGLGIGLGFTLSLSVLGTLRELLGTGSVFAARDFGFAGLHVFSKELAGLVMILPPGAFITLGLLLALLNYLLRKREGMPNKPQGCH